MVFKLVHTGRSGKNIFEVEEADKKASCFLLSPLLRVNKSICDVIYEMSAGCVCVCVGGFGKLLTQITLQYQPAHS